MILQETIDRVTETAVCTEVISDFIEIKKNGANYKGLSPFSEEKTPSFVVRPSKNIWKCFSSGKGGNSVTFLMESQKMSYVESILYIGKKYNIEIKETKTKNKTYDYDQSRQQLFDVMDSAKDYYYKNGLNKDVCVDYLKNRGYTDKTIKKFGLGYSNDAWRDLSDDFIPNKCDSNSLEEVGLISTKGRKYWDKFRDRIMFPIQDHRNRTVGFGARVYNNNDPDAPKYINSIETRIYNKSKLLYGLNLAIDSIVKNENVYIVEGYTDVISFHQSKVCNTVATCGTSLTVEQLTLIKRYTSNVTFVFDGAKAGLRASHRSIDMALYAGLDVKIIKLKDIDPDELSKTIKNLSKYLDEQVLDFVDFKESFININNVDDNAKLINNIITSSSYIKDDVKKQLYLSKISKKFNIDYDKLKKSAKTVYLENKRVYKDDIIDDVNDVEKLVDLYHNNSELMINKYSLAQNIYLRITELYNQNLYDLDLKNIDLFKKPNSKLKSLLNKDEVLSQLNHIFKNIKKRIIIQTIDKNTELLLSDSDNKNRSKISKQIQYLIYLKNNL